MSEPKLVTLVYDMGPLREALSRRPTPQHVIDQPQRDLERVRSLLAEDDLVPQ